MWVPRQVPELADIRRRRSGLRSSTKIAEPTTRQAVAMEWSSDVESTTDTDGCVRMSRARCRGPSVRFPTQRCTLVIRLLRRCAPRSAFGMCMRMACLCTLASSVPCAGGGGDGAYAATRARYERGIKRHQGRVEGDVEFFSLHHLHPPIHPHPNPTTAFPISTHTPTDVADTNQSTNQPVLASVRIPFEK